MVSAGVGLGGVAGGAAFVSPLVLFPWLVPVLGWVVLLVVLPLFLLCDLG